MSYSIIAAIGKNNELGYKNDLIWHLPNDLKFFRKTTNGKTIIMGRNTFESLRGLLPNRKHVVLTTSKNNYRFPDEVTVYNNLDELLNSYKNTNEEIFIIGGSSLYKEFLDISDKLYLTLIDDEFKNADVYFPSFNKDNYDEIVLDTNNENNIDYKHVLYKRKK